MPHLPAPTTLDPAPDDVYYDPFSHEINRDPHACFARLRELAPLYYNERYDFYALSRYDDIQQVRLDTETFSNAEGIGLERMMSDLLHRQMLIEMDPPEHHVMRRVANRQFTPKALRAREPDVREICRRLLDPLVGAGRFDYVQDFGRDLPMLVTCGVLGIDGSLREELRPVLQQRDEAFGQEVPDLATAARTEETIRQQLCDLARLRKAHPRDDLISLLANATIDDGGTVRPLTDDELGSYGLVLFAGGNMTTTLMLGWIGFLLAEHPDQRRLLVDRPELIPNAVEEVLRFEPIAHSQGRTTTREVELYGQSLAAGTKVLLLTGATSRDPARYDRPDEFDVARETVGHTAFGWGIHACIGAHQARLVGQVALEETLARFPQWTVDSSRAVMRVRTTMRGYTELPISVPAG